MNPLAETSDRSGLYTQIKILSKESPKQLQGKTDLWVYMPASGNKNKKTSTETGRRETKEDLL